jgi:hypothetical protein
MAHNTRDVDISNIEHIGDINSGTLVSGSAQGGVFPSTIPYGIGAGLVDRFIRLISGTGAGQKRRIVTHNYAQGGTAGANAFTVDKPWTVVPDNTTVFKVGLPYQGGAGTIYGTAAWLSDSYDNFRMANINIIGDFFDRTPFLINAHISSSIPLGRRMVFDDIRLDISVAQAGNAASISIGGVGIIFKGMLTHRDVWPSGEKGLIAFQAGTTGKFEIELGGNAPYSRVAPAAGCDCDIILSSKNGKPIPYQFQWAALAATRGVRIRSQPIEALYPALTTAFTGAATTAVNNLGALDFSGTYEVSALIQNTARTEVARFSWLVNLTKGTSVQILSRAVEAIAGTAMSAATLTSTVDGVLSATVTHSATITGATASWSYRILNAH